jgi:hypothetical protein
MIEGRTPFVENETFGEREPSKNWPWGNFLGWGCFMGCLGIAVIVVILIMLVNIPFTYSEVDSDSRGELRVSLISSNSGGYYVRLESGVTMLDERDLGYTHFNHNPEWYPEKIEWFKEDAVCVVNGEGPDSLNVLPIVNRKVGESHRATQEEIWLIHSFAVARKNKKNGSDMFDDRQAKEMDTTISTPNGSSSE